MQISTSTKTITDSRCLLSHNPTLWSLSHRAALQGIGVDTRFGRYFRFMPYLEHLRIDTPLDKWHLEQIDKYYSSQLISLFISYNKRKHQHLFKRLSQLFQIEMPSSG
uniref:Uncharacterized protein n=1 Tax=Ditylenchus dipsaci TaxID=166011 RepID=A0A915CPG5_9BILA